ncbi:MAG TPA: hypothetical protein VGQ26_29930 [Streptosporangiaceae bacterium]|jgi:hypothetical protein|nr:hypothetical protein [Streptosporangiaceae bacterium]
MTVIDITARLTQFGEPADLTFASGDQAQVIGLGHGIGLGMVTADGAAMGTLTKEEARQLGRS